MPGWEGGEAVCDEFGFVEAGVFGPFGDSFAGDSFIFFSSDGNDFRVDASLAEDFFGEVGPGDVAAFVGGVVVSVFVGF